MSKTRVRVEMDDEQKILLKRSLNKNGAGQKFFTTKSDVYACLMSQN